LGVRHKRPAQDPYDAFIDAYVTTALKIFPEALLHWEDFGPGNARRILDRYRDHILTFNDDMQGTGAVNLAAVLAGARASQTPLTKHRVVILAPVPQASASPTNSVTPWPAKDWTPPRRGHDCGAWTATACSPTT